MSHLSGAHLSPPFAPLRTRPLTHVVREPCKRTSVTRNHHHTLPGGHGEGGRARAARACSAATRPRGAGHERGGALRRAERAGGRAGEERRHTNDAKARLPPPVGVELHPRCACAPVVGSCMRACGVVARTGARAERLAGSDGAGVLRNRCRHYAAAAKPPPPLPLPPSLPLLRAAPGAHVGRGGSAAALHGHGADGGGRDAPTGARPAQPQHLGGRGFAPCHPPHRPPCYPPTPSQTSLPARPPRPLPTFSSSSSSGRRSGRRSGTRRLAGFSAAPSTAATAVTLARARPTRRPALLAARRRRLRTCLAARAGTCSRPRWGMCPVQPIVW